MASSDRESLRRLANPTYSGPGNWHFMHQLAANVKNFNDLVVATKKISEFLRSLRCQECLSHAQAYEQANPLKNLLDCKHHHHPGGVEECLFFWLFTFHNAVNARLGKPILGYDMVKKFYYDPTFEVCTKKCDAEEPPATQAITYYTKGNIRIVPR